MKNLIKEINNNKLLSNSKISEDFKRGFNRGLDLSQEILNQYNIITAPKSIKLSELIDRICETKFKNDHWVELVKPNSNDYRIIIKWSESPWDEQDFFIRDKKIEKYNLNLPKDEFKWLYILCIAETEIVDDVECDE